MSNKRKLMDLFQQSLTYLAASIGVITLFMIVFFVFSNGYKLLNFGLIVNNYHAVFYNGGLQDDFTFSDTQRPPSLSEDRTGDAA